MRLCANTRQRAAVSGLTWPEAWGGLEIWKSYELDEEKPCDSKNVCVWKEDRPICWCEKLSWKFKIWELLARDEVIIEDCQCLLRHNELKMLGISKDVAWISYDWEIWNQEMCCDMKHYWEALACNKTWKGRDRSCAQTNRGRRRVRWQRLRPSFSLSWIRIRLKSRTNFHYV